MKTSSFINFLTLLYCCFAITLTVSAKSGRSDKPNVIIIFTDELGYGDIGCFGAKGYQTPAIDKMAEQPHGNKDTTKAVQLFNLKKDPNEIINLANQYPEKVTERAKRLKEEYGKIIQTTR
ncbi:MULTISPECIES: hypothetical protein [unclassified Saccharicrinis]|uniref:hypothetical protein n=1 Tax=unclassified Saccharicrinis TaxID=2646859 RepID=UPI003D33BFEB